MLDLESIFGEPETDRAVAVLAEPDPTDALAFDLSGAELGGANLSGAVLNNAVMGGCIFGGVDLTRAKSLKTVKHEAPSTLGTDALTQSQGGIPDSFLRGCGLAEWEVLQAKLYDPGLTASEISELQYQIFDKRAHGPIFTGGVFLSYSHNDSKFVDKLYKRLKDEGVSVWLDRRDLAGGPLQKQIWRAIRWKDVLVLVLSKTSVKSRWVANELEMARRREEDENRDVIYPVALDDSWTQKMELEEHLAAAAVTGHALDSETARWVAELGDDLADKLARVGLIPERESATLADFLQAYIDSRIDVKPASRVIFRHVKRNLTEFLGPDRSLRSISPSDAEDFRLYLVGEGLAASTIAKRLQRARQMFAAMKRRKLIEENPFAEVRHQDGDASERQRSIDGEQTAKLLEAAPDWIWRTIIALARYGGLRCPSEVLSLKWADVDWERARMRVASPKTEHHAGKGSRLVPMFPELRPYLEEAWDTAEEGQEHVVPTKYRNAALGPEGWRNCNLRTHFERIVKRAGLEPWLWPRPFHNLRASRETELAGLFPVHVVTAWLGNTPRIAMKHYLQVTESDFAKAVQKAMHPVQNPPTSATIRQEMTEPQDALGVRRGLAAAGEIRQPPEMVRAEPSSNMRCQVGRDKPLVAHPITPAPS
ncbi:MAG: TIR domain-containing protein [Planctomycetota bacterium]|jgi:integrase